ncbi:MAG: sodium-dependent bicarbonate transport family permease [Pseudomonadota bacterium]
MESVADIATTIVAQFQKPTLAFLIGGMVLAALGSKLVVPEPVYKFVVILLLLTVGMGAGISMREAELSELLAPALVAIILGAAIAAIGGFVLSRRPGIKPADGMATAGLFGAVSASTLAAGMAILDSEGIAYEGFIAALYPFMDVAALVTAIVLARLSLERQAQTVVYSDGTAAMSGGGSTLQSPNNMNVRAILVDTVRSPAISALLFGLLVGVFARPDGIYETFYQDLFRGLLSILMLTMGMEGWARLSELRKVAFTYVLYGIAAPLLHGLLGLGAGLILHQLTGFSMGGVVLLAVMAGSSSDVSGPPTMRGALPEANPSAYVGTSTGLGTPVAILAIPLWIALAQHFMT